MSEVVFALGCFLSFKEQAFASLGCQQTWIFCVEPKHQRVVSSYYIIEQVWT